MDVEFAEKAQSMYSICHIRLVHGLNNKVGSGAGETGGAGRT